MSLEKGTVFVSGSDVIQTQDFYVRAGILHPVTLGSIAVMVLFAYLRMDSNRYIAPITVFDWVVDVAFGITLAGIVNGNSLVRGLLALVTMLGFQYIISTVASRFQRLTWIFQGPPLVLAFRGDMLKSIMRKHRISSADVNAALRQKGVLNISRVECAIIEPNGSISVFTTADLEKTKIEPDVLMAVTAYKALCEQGECGEEGKKKDEASYDQNSVAIDIC